MEQYYYCQVQPKGMHSVFSYLGEDDVRIGSFVEIPFGEENRRIKGRVLEVGYYTAEDAPFPVERTKHILRIMTPEEYDDPEDSSDPDTDFWGSELEEAQLAIENEDYDEIFEWAYEHSSFVDFPEIIAKVVECYELCVEQNNPTAALNLGAMYYTGHGLPRDYGLAVKYYEIAAAAGEVRALCNLGYCYYYGRHQEADYQRAYQYFSLGALLADDANCLYKLGDLYENGLYVQENRKYAFRLFCRALDVLPPNGEEAYCEPDIRLRIGRALLRGDVVERDLLAAFDLLSQALSGFYRRRKGSPAAQGQIAAARKLLDEALELLEAEEPLPPSPSRSGGAVRGTIRIWPGTLARLRADALVHASREDLGQSGSGDAELFQAAGENLRQCCEAIGHCDAGKAVLTPAFGLDANGVKWIIHAVVPRWTDNPKAPEQLYMAYINALRLGKERNCHSIGFPLLSAGAGCSVEKAWQLGIQACRDFLSMNPDYELLIFFSAPEQDVRAVGIPLLRTVCEEKRNAG